MHPFGRLPAKLLTTDLISRIARVGAVTPDLLAALWIGCRLEDLTTEEVCRMDRRVLALVRRGLVRRHVVRTPLKALRTGERILVKLTPAGQARLSSGNPEDSLDGDILRSVRDWPLSGTGGYACLMDLRHTVLYGWSHTRNARHRVRGLVRQGLLHEAHTRTPQHLPLLILSEKGLARLRQAERRTRLTPVPPVRSPRLDHAVHHLLVLLAAANLAERSGLRVHCVRGDEELRSAARRGRRFTAGSTHPALPDGALTLIDEDGHRTELAVEVIVSGYTDVQILKKYAELPADTFYVVVSARLADRVEGLGLPRPLLVS